MKFFSIFAAMFVCAAGLRGDELPWQDDYAKTLAEAADKHQPVLLDFTASWCGPCRMMETTTFADPGVRDELKGYLLVKIDLDRAHDLAARYHVEAIPTCIVLNQFGEKVDGRTGYIDAAHFAAWIHECEDAAFSRQSQAENLRVMVKQAATRLEAADDAERAAGLEYLLSAYCRLDSRESGEAKMATSELREWFGRHPERAVPLLNEQRLAVRILFAGLFAEKLGASFQLDPWDGAGSRAAVVERIAAQMGARPR